MADAKESTTNSDEIPLLSVGSLTKLVTVLAAFAYGTGVVAINTYLHGLGITDFSFAKPKLLLTGTLVLASFLLLASVPYLLIWRWSERRAGEATTKALSPVLLAIGIVSFCGLVIIAFLLCFRLETPLGQIQAWWIWERIRPKSDLGRTWAAIVIVAGLYIPAWTSALSAFRATRIWALVRTMKGQRGITIEYFRMAGAIAILLLSVIGYIMMFTFNFYPSVPVEFGGGEPYFESFAIADSQQCELRQVGIPFGKTATGVTSPLPVLHESDSLVAVWLQRKAETESATGAVAEAAAKPEESSAPEESDTKHAAVVDNDTSGLGRAAVIVVQLDKSSVVATKAYPHWRRVPAMAAFSGSCTAGASSNAGPVGAPTAK